MTYTGLETYVQQAAFHKTLSRLYGAEGAEKAHSRCMEVMEEFYKTFDRPAEALFSAPGRTEIGGNHTDHQKGCVLAASVDVKVELYDGSFHEVDSSEMAFKIAGSMAFKEAMRKGDAVLLEPIMKVTVITPDDYLGDVIGDLNSRRGQIQGMDARHGVQQVNSFVPLSEMFGYATDLRSKTQGRGQYTMEPSHYVEVPKSIGEKIISARTKGE